MLKELCLQYDPCKEDCVAEAIPLVLRRGVDMTTPSNGVCLLKS